MWTLIVCEVSHMKFEMVLQRPLHSFEGYWQI